MPVCEPLKSARPTPKIALNLLLAASFSAFSLGAAAQSSGLPVTEQQRSTAERVAQAGVPLSELASDAARLPHRQDGRHALGHLPAVLEKPLALA